VWDHQKIKEAIENYIPSNNRSQLVERGTNKFILDAYNANPTSMKNALTNFKKLDYPNKVAVLGDMLELGDYSYDEHENIAEIAFQMELKYLILVGSEFAKVKIKDALKFENVVALKKWFNQKDFQNTYFLMKGSRGIKLEQLISNE